MLMRRDGGTEDRDYSEGNEGDCPFEASYPATFQFLTLAAWPDGGGERTPGTLSFFHQDGYIKARLVDVDADEVCFVSAMGLPTLLARVEAVLRDGTGEWRKQRPWQGKKKP